MGTLYDLLGALPNDDAEGLRTAFRKAAKATHPDLHPDIPEAALRFRQLMRAHDILSDAEQRATYDQLLTIATKPAPSKSKHVYERVQRFASSTIAATVISGVLVAAYTLMGPVPPAPVAAESTIPIAARAPADVAARPESAPRGSEVLSTAALASVADTKAWIAGAGPVPHVAGNEAKSEQASEVSPGTGKPATLPDLQRDLGFLPLYSTRDVNRAFAEMERNRRATRTKLARAAEARASTAMVLEVPPVLRLRRTRMTQAITP